MTKNLWILFAVLPALGSPTAAAPSQPLCPGCDIMFVSFDATQAAHVHSLGYPRDITPTFDALAKKGYLFKQAVSGASWTVPASMSWMTGTYPSLHRITNKYSIFTEIEKKIDNLKDVSPQMLTLAELLKKNGYATGGFTGDAGVNGMFGFNQGFDVYSDQVPPFSGFDRSIPAALDWVHGRKDGKFFLFLHSYGNHGQYQPKSGFDRRFVDTKYSGPYDGSPQQQRDLREKGLQGELKISPEDVAFWRAIYDEKIARSDSAFGIFMSSMTAMGALDKTILVLVSDHGTETYEHGKFDHGVTLYDEMVHVPLAIIVPGMKGGEVLPQQVSTIDLMPTLFDLVGIDPGDAVRRQMKGRSLVPLMTGAQRQGEDAYFETDYRLYTHKRGIRTTDGWKFIIAMESGKRELYNLSADPAETRNLIAAMPEMAYEIEQRLFRRYKELGIDLDAMQWASGCLPVYADQCK